jgi:hypothetical protein
MIVAAGVAAHDFAAKRRDDRSLHVVDGWLQPPALSGLGGLIAVASPHRARRMPLTK